MKHYIWDLDGTLIESYVVICEGVSKTADYFNFPIDKDKLLFNIKNTTATKILKDIAAFANTSFENVNEYYQQYCTDNFTRMSMVKNADITLNNIINNGNYNYIITTRDKLTFSILDNLNLRDKFRYIITASSIFPNKPDPTSLLFLLDKFNISKDDVYYIGDRKIDMDFGENANVKTILFLPKDSPVKNANNANIVVENLIDILKIK